MKKIKELIVTSIFLVLFSLNLNSKVLAQNNYNVERIYGQTRYETSVNIANNFKSGVLEKVIVANGNDFPDALSGSVLSKKLNAPIILVNNKVSESTTPLNYIKNNLDKKGTIYILGGKGAVSEDFIKVFKEYGFNNIVRIGGTDRFDTNKKIVDKMQVNSGTPVVIVNGYNFPDALSISSVVGFKQYPILLSSSKRLSNKTKKIINEIKPSYIYLIGGTGVLNNNVVSEVKSLVPSLEDSNIKRIGGKNRYETSLNICKYFGYDTNTVILASGENFPDALSGTSLASKLNSPVILTNGKNIDSQKEYIESIKKYTNIILLGGNASINKSVEDNLKGIEETKKVYSVKDIAQNSEAVVYIEVMDENKKVFASGSGFIVNPNGIVVTNFHVIEKSSFAKVFLEDGSSYEVEGVLNCDKDRDIAILKLKNVSSLPIVKLGDSDKIERADNVVAIGSPQGYRSTISTGIISGLDRNSNIRKGKDIQFTAAITHGSSGGALFNMHNEVIGITYSGYESGDLGFAIPINEVKPYLLKEKNLKSLEEVNNIKLNLNYDDYEEDSIIDRVQRGHFNGYKYLSIKEAFREFFVDTKWEYFKSTEDEDIVQFTGNALYNNNKVKILIQFVVNVEQETFSVAYEEKDGQPLSDTEWAVLIDKIYSNN